MCDYREEKPEENSESMTNGRPELNPEDYRETSRVENPEEYRRSPSMRAEQDRRYDYWEEKNGNSESGRYEYSDRRYNYGGDEGRYRYDNTDRREQRGSRRPPKKNNKMILIIIVCAILVGGMIGAACWSIGRLVSASVPSSGLIAGSAEESKEAPPPYVEPETEEAAAGLENSGEAVIPQTPSAEVAPGSVLVSDIPDVVDMCMPSIVAITTKYVYENYNTYGYNPFFGYGYGNGSGGSNTYETTGAGSGIIIGDDGEELWVVTNNHVVEDSEEVQVGFVDGETVEAYIKGTDSDNDLAVVGVKLSDLKAETRQAIKAIQMGDSETLRLGENVIAIGNALGIGQSVTSGIVSAKDREITTNEGATLTTIQIDAAINPGNSGGALLDSTGKLVGINVAKGVEQNVEGMGYAIPISSAIDIIQNLTTMKPRVPVSEDKYPYMGVELKDINSSYAEAYNIPAGILVYTVTEDGPSAKAGILTQDIITKFNGVKVANYDALKNELRYYEAGTEVTVTISRLENGAYVEKELKLTLGRKSDYVKEEETTPAADNSAGGSGDQGGYRFSFPGFNW